MQVRALGREDPLEEVIATHSLQYSCLESPKDRGAWWAMVHRVAKSWAPLSNLAWKDVPHVLVPGRYEYVSLHGKRDIAGVTKLRVLRWGD